MIKKHTATESDRRRDKEAKIYRYMAQGYSQYDAELMAQAEIEIEE